MHIARLKLAGRNLKELERFYTSILEFPLIEASSYELRLQAGSTKLIFEDVPDSNSGLYHFAFNIPENKFDEAKSWISQRVPLVTNHAGENEFYSAPWDAHIVYFNDPDGNILELIARHTLDNASTIPFDSSQILCVSEIGIATEDVKSLAEQLNAQMDLPVYGELTDDFTPIGDENGLFIVVKNGRNWFPTAHPSSILPMQATIYNQWDDGFSFSTTQSG